MNSGSCSSGRTRSRSGPQKTATCSNRRWARSASRSRRRDSRRTSTKRSRSAKESGFRSWSGRASFSEARAPASRTTATSSSRLPRTVSRRARSHTVLVERSIAGWKEFELEVMRDVADNCVVVCSIENFDPMGVHTGDSITVAPAQTLSDLEYQEMRDDAFACIRRVGVETGGSNIQFAVNPDDGKTARHRDEPAGSRDRARSPPRRPGSRSRRSLPGSRSDTRSTR